MRSALEAKWLWASSVWFVQAVTWSWLICMPTTTNTHTHTLILSWCKDVHIAVVLMRWHCNHTKPAEILVELLGTTAFRYRQWSVFSGLHHATLQPWFCLNQTRGVKWKVSQGCDSVVLCLTASGEQGGEVRRRQQSCLASYETRSSVKNSLNAIVVLGPWTPQHSHHLVWAAAVSLHLACYMCTADSHFLSHRAWPSFYNLGLMLSSF